MIGKFLTTACVAVALTLVPVERAEADAGEFIGGALIGGIIGYAAGQNQQPRTRTVVVPQQQTTTRTVTRVVRPSIPVTQEGRETQTALNFFGFDAGAVDGQVGPGTRAAIERYQVAMGYPVNGREFPSYQFDFLMDAYYWSTQQGGAMQTGMRGPALLYAYRDSLQGRNMQTFAPAPLGQPPATTVIVNPGQTAPNAPVTIGAQPGAPATIGAQPTTPVAIGAQPGAPATIGAQPAAPATIGAAPGGATAAATGGALPNLFAGSGSSPSLANACNPVMLETASSGGQLTLANMTDPDRALFQQFCVARTYAMSRGEELMGQITGLTRAQVAEQCNAFSAMLSGQIDRVSLVAHGDLTAEMQQFAGSTGMAPADLAATSRVCLSVGYAQDDMRMAVGSALMLVALGEPAYGELLGHHLREGYGTTNRPDLAMGWYEASISALEGGASPAFMPGQPERPQLLRAATAQLGTGTAPAPVATPQPVAALPTFPVSE